MIFLSWHSSNSCKYTCMFDAMVSSIVTQWGVRNPTLNKTFTANAMKATKPNTTSDMTTYWKRKKNCRTSRNLGRVYKSLLYNWFSSRIKKNIKTLKLKMKFEENYVTWAKYCREYKSWYTSIWNKNLTSILWL